MSEDGFLERYYEDRNGAPEGDEQDDQDYDHEPPAYAGELDWPDSDTTVEQSIG